MNYKLKKISGDASFREFYRLKKNYKTSIIVFAKKEKYKNLIVYSIVNNILNTHKISAPKLISNHYKNNMIEISDLGNKSFYDFIISKKNKMNDYKSLIKLIFKLQKIKIKKNYILGKNKFKFIKYSLDNLHKESNLFFDWYLKYSLKKKIPNKIKKLLRNELNKVYKKLNFKNDTFVHRDFHASNIMYDKKKLGVIDSQDAIIGNPLYDVASLIDDVRIKLPQDLQNNLFKFYYKNSKYKKEKIEKLKKDFDILSVQRNLKILGIFVRLSKRDNKLNYLKYLPYTWLLIERRMKNPVFNKLNILFKKYLPLKKLKKLQKNMKIRRGMILAAGLGKRMQPITLKTPKPLIQIGNQNLLERAIELLINHGIDEIAINVHYLADQIIDFINKKKYKIKIKIFHEQDMLLDTGGGILNATKSFKEPFVAINPDTLWSNDYSNELCDLEDLYFQHKKACLLLVNKNLSFDSSFNGDFNLQDKIVSRDNRNELIFTGLQILDHSVFRFKKDKIFSMNNIWNNLITNKLLIGIESKKKFYHLNTKEMHDKILSLNITD